MLNREQIKNLQEQLDKIACLESDMKIGAVNSAKFESDFHTYIRDIKTILANDEISDKEKGIFNNSIVNKNLYRSIPKPGSMPDGGDIKKIEELKEKVETIIGMSSNLDPNKKEWNFSVADVFNAKRFIIGTLKKATNKIKIIDNYLDEELFDYIDSLDSALQIKLITDGKIKIFQNLYKAYIPSHTNVEARINNQSHDRFIIIDDQEYFAFGASLNTIGKKDFMVHKIEAESEKSKKLQDFENYWSGASKII